jgi:hypothetical protein
VHGPDEATGGRVTVAREPVREAVAQRGGHERVDEVAGPDRDRRRTGAHQLDDVLDAADTTATDDGCLREGAVDLVDDPHRDGADRGPLSPP